MIRAIANKPLDLSDEEFEYYLSIIQAFGPNIFQNTFEVDDNETSLKYGWITLVTPPLNATIPMGVIMFLFNVQLNQRMRKIDAFLLKDKI